MENVMTVNAETRDQVGKKIAKKLRKEGKIPAIIYGGDKETIPVSLIVDEVKHILKSEKGENTVLRIHRDDIKVDAMLHEIQYDYLSDNIIHVDLLRIDISKPVSISVPVKLNGTPIGVRLEDGSLDFVTRELKIKCLVTAIPNEFEIEITDLHSGSSIKADDLDIAEGIELISDPQTVICAVTAKAKEEEVLEEVEEEVAEGEEAAEGEGEKPAEGKKEETTEDKAEK